MPRKRRRRIPYSSPLIITREAGFWVLPAGGLAALLEAVIRYDGDPAATGPLRDWQAVALRVLAIHAVIAATYSLWPHKAPVPAASASKAGRSAS
ncbi:hypothetical protein [Streptomyces sp. G-G2]|uniref:hypothetical protein n=1 Tax=Streptomyces sp. G-G2 TaxID=3046201 RepID=UPI0024BA3DE2|nr:hypothetical protein [Streptomyces sp. G-G2]MDJ0379379.1 hypothetical protein [Streptomyces sp. G-G2]